MMSGMPSPPLGRGMARAQDALLGPRARVLGTCANLESDRPYDPAPSPPRRTENGAGMTPPPARRPESLDFLPGRTACTYSPPAEIVAAIELDRSASESLMPDGARWLEKRCASAAASGNVRPTRKSDSRTVGGRTLDTQKSPKNFRGRCRCFLKTVCRVRHVCMA